MRIPFLVALVVGSVTAVGCSSDRCSSNAECADDNSCTVDRCENGYCESRLADDGAGCDDGDPCTVGDGCKAGVCIRGTGPKDSDGDRYVDAQCAGGDDCDDGRAEVNPEVQEGPFGDQTCADGLDNDCDHATDEQDSACRRCRSDLDCDDSSLCTHDRCANEVCENTPGAAGLACDDGVYCNGADRCDAAGRCLVHEGDPCLSLDQRCDQENLRCVDCLTAADCDDNIVCTVETCHRESGECGHTLDNGRCGDGVFCNGVERCNPGAADRDPLTGCVSPGDPCAGELQECNRSCNEASGNCFDLQGTPCGGEAINLCTGPGVCDGGGKCLGEPKAVGTSCDDTFFCNGSEGCDGLGGCTVRTGNPCGAKGCDEATHGCLSNGTRVSFSQLAAGYTHSCGLAAHGVAYCWGSDNYGQLGTGGGIGRSWSPVAVDTAPVTGEKAFVHLVTDLYHSCGLTVEGVVYCWGMDKDGQLGNGGGALDSQSPVALDVAPITGNRYFVQLALGVFHSCGLTAEGIAYCWGRDEFGQLGDGGTSVSSQSPVAVDRSAIAGTKVFVQLAGGDRYNCGLTVEGAVYCWGRDEFGQLGDGGEALDSQIPVALDVAPITGNRVIVQLIAGAFHTCALTAEGIAYCWGRDEAYQLGTGVARQNSQSPVAVDMSSVTGDNVFVQLVAGVTHTCGVTAARIVYCWGGNSQGQLGNGGTAEYSPSPAAVDTSQLTGDKTFIRLDAGKFFTCGLTAERVAYCWGQNEDGQLGNGSPSATVQKPAAVDISQLAGGKAFVELTAGGAHAGALAAEGIAYCWGADEHGQLGAGTTAGDPQSPGAVGTFPIPGVRTMVGLAAGAAHTCGLTAEGVAYCWGQDDRGQLGDGGGATDTQTAVAVDSAPITGSEAFVRLTAGAAHTCGVTTEGEAYCWGSDQLGQLGNGGAAVDSQSPVLVATSTIPGAKTFVKMTAGGSHTCGLTVDGVAYCWGTDRFGQLGNGGTAADAQAPTAVDTSAIPGCKAFVHLSAGTDHTCGVTAEGVGYCWGRDTNGQLGDGGAFANSQSPVAVDGSSVNGGTVFQRMAAGVNHTCGLTATGAAYCWGADAFGQLGNGGAATDSGSPVAVNTSPITGSRAFVGLAAGEDFTCGLTADGVAYCWGRDTDGRLGNGPFGGSQSPVAVNTMAL